MIIRVAFFALLTTAGTLPGQTSTRGMVPESEAWYLPTADRAGELFIYEVGTGGGAPVVVLHGGPGAELTYMLPSARGLESEFRFVFYDQRGSLRSNVVLDSVTMAKHVEDLETLRQALGVDRVRLLSHSAGTLLAYEYLRAHPERVAEMALVGALPHKNGSAYFDDEYAELWKPVGDQMKRFQERDAVRRELAMIDSMPGLTPFRREAARRQLRQVDLDLFHVERWPMQIPIRVKSQASQRTRESTNFDYDFGPDLAAHPFRITVINGHYDVVVGPEGSPLWRRLQETTAANIHVEVLPEAGHGVWVDQPVLFEAALRKALSGRGPG